MPALLITAMMLAAPLHATPASRRYLIDSPSSATARVAFFGFAKRTARFPRVAGSVMLDAGGADGRIAIDVAIDAAALTASDSVTRERLKGPAFFDVARTREVRFVGTRMRLTDPRHATIEGTLTARGTARPVTLSVAFSQPIDQLTPDTPLRMTGSTTIDRTDFGMTAYALIVGRKVAIELDVTLRPLR